MSRPIPHHTYKGYRIYGCRKKCCSQARREYQRSVSRSIAEGTWNPWGDAEQVRRHLEVLFNRGWSARSVGERAGCAADTVRALWANPEKRIRRSIAEAIVSIGLDELAARVPVYRLSRRLRALARMGWGLTTLAEKTGLGLSCLDRVRNERDRYTRRWIAQEILRVYEQLHHIPSPSPQAPRVRARARAQRWLTDIEWDGLIDLSPAELDAELARQVALLDEEDLAAARTAYRKHGERSVLVVAAAYEYERLCAERRSKRKERTRASLSAARSDHEQLPSSLQPEHEPQDVPQEHTPTTRRIP